MKCVRDGLTGVCVHHEHAARQVVFVPVDGRRVFFICLLLILMCVVWLALWAAKGVRFEEDA